MIKRHNTRRSLLAVILITAMTLSMLCMLPVGAAAVQTPPFTAVPAVSGNIATVALKTSAAMDYSSLEVKLANLPQGIKLTAVSEGSDLAAFSPSEEPNIGETIGLFAILNENETVHVQTGKELTVYTFDISAASGGTHTITFVFSAASDIDGNAYEWENGKITAEIVKGTVQEGYTISLNNVSNGTVTLSKTNAKKGEKISITPKPISGYTVKDVSVYGPNGIKLTLTYGGGSYTFIMPDGPVTVSVVFSGPDRPFTDVPERAWYFADVYAARDLGLMEGIGNGQFAPGNTLTIAEAVTLAARARSIYLKDGEMFRRHDEWYRTYADYAMKHGILKSEPADWSAAATRDYCASLFAAAMPADALKAINRVDNGAIPDVPADDTAVYVLYRAGVMVGDGEHKFHPSDSIQRCEIAAVVNRMLRPETRLTVDLRK